MAINQSNRARPAASLGRPSARAVLLSILTGTQAVIAQSDCISLKGSSQCGAFESASVTKSQSLVDQYGFLDFVSDTASFDKQLKQYVQTTYVQQKYQQVLGCGNVNLQDTADLYARFTTSTICNVLVQKSIEDCSLSEEASRPMCADDCTLFAQSESYIVEDPTLCSNPNSNADSLIRSDFAGCTLPPGSLLPSCIQAITNEPDNCGYGTSTTGLCSYCAEGGINSTDTCCYSSNAESVCADVVLPTIVPTMSFSTPVPTSSSTSTSTPTQTTAAAAPSSNNSLSGGAIAGIVIGSVAGAAIILAMLIFCCLRMRKRKDGSQNGSILNQPSPSRKGPQTTQAAVSSPPKGYTVLPGGRIARMSALEGHSADSPSRHGGSRQEGSAGAAAAAAGFGAGRRRGEGSSSDDFAASIESDRRMGVLRPPPANIRRNGSLSSNSMLVGEDPQSPTSAGGMSSPPGVNSQQSEQLPFFKDYYSQDDIHPGDRVSVLWAYQPRAPDEFALERGDMLKVVGIWDDGWATGIMMDERADEWEARRQNQRDSGVSNTSGRGRDISPPVSGEIKAFPLVCVCLPEHWRKTIEGEGSTENGSSAHQG